MSDLDLMKEITRIVHGWRPEQAADRVAAIRAVLGSQSSPTPAPRGSDRTERTGRTRSSRTSEE